MNARHAAAEGTFARSAGGAAGRGILLVGLAVLLGIALMTWTLDGPGDGVVAGPNDTSATGPTDTTDAGPASTTPDGSVAPTTTPGETTVPPAAIPPETIKVVVANGTSTQGAAGAFTEQLINQAYVTGSATNADANTYTESRVYYMADNPSGLQAAQQVATVLNVATAPEPMPALLPLRDPAALDDALVLVVIGSDLAAAPA